MDPILSVKRAKEFLEAARAEVMAEAAQMVRDRLAEYQEALDIAVRIALEAGATRSFIAATAGESRVTINERLDRTKHEKVDTSNLPDLAKTDKRRAVERKPKEKAPEAKPAYEYDGEFLTTKYEDYGPEHLTGEVKFEAIYEELDGSWGFMLVSAGDGEDEATIVNRLDMHFTGWYYEDANRFMKEQA